MNNTNQNHISSILCVFSKFANSGAGNLFLCPIKPKQSLMKNFEIATLIENGVLSLTVHNLSTAHSYKIVKFKAMLKKAYEDFFETRNNLAKEAGIENPQEFDKRLEELRGKKELTSEEKKEFADMNLQLAKLNDMRKSLGEEDVTLEGVKSMPYDQWKVLQDENKEIKIGNVELMVLCEDALENVLWRAPEEKEEE